jgi:hypothetical protein
MIDPFYREIPSNKASISHDDQTPCYYHIVTHQESLLHLFQDFQTLIFFFKHSSAFPGLLEYF